MELPICKTKARFAAAARGERVVVNKDGCPFVELVRAQKAYGMDFEKAAIVRRELGLDGLNVRVPLIFNDLAFSRQVLGLLD